MDILTDILSSADIKKTLLASYSFYDHFAASFPCDRSMGFHVVTQGEVYVRAKRLRTPLTLRKGDLILLARGFNHDLTTDLELLPSTQGWPAPQVPAPRRAPRVTLASGVYHFATPPIHPLFKELPDKLLLRAEAIASHSPLHSALLLLSSELSQNELGSEAVTRNLLDILFHYILRTWMNSTSDGARGWNLALKDAHLIKAIQAIHERPEHGWSVEELAKVAGVSRATFAQRFKQQTLDTPAHYLAKVRIQKAAQFLRAGQHNVEEVASLVGYHDSFVFSKAFKRLQGVSPRAFKQAAQAT
ncbi:MAG: AraC family transcriptional regulator [Polyangiaceae bacterium]